MRSLTATLPTLEVAVRRRCAALPRRERVGVHPQAHRAAGVAPLRTGLGEDAVQALLLGLLLHEHRSRYDENSHARCDAATTQHLCGRAQVFHPAVRAGAE